MIVSGSVTENVWLVVVGVITRGGGGRRGWGVRMVGGASSDGGLTLNLNSDNTCNMIEKKIVCNQILIIIYSTQCAAAVAPWPSTTHPLVWAELALNQYTTRF